MKQFIFVTAFLAISGAYAGTLSEDLIKGFSLGGLGEKKDVIFEYNSILGNVLDSSAISSLSGDDRNNAIINMLKQSTQSMQAPLLNALSSMGLGDRATPFWIDNKVAVSDVGLGPLKALAAIPGPFTVREAYTAKIFPLVESDHSENLDLLSKRQSANSTYQWGVVKINAPTVFAAGFTGVGVTVGVIDTGVNVNHVALSGSYKNDDYSWFDAFNKYKTPYDGNGHGTHCAGTIAGTMNGIGVAPGAKWIACRGLDDKGSGGEASLTACGQFMACPNNSTGNCTGMPDIVSNSWGGAMGGQTWFNKVIAAWRAVNIIPVFAIGNSGPLCATAGSPGDQEKLISVGSTDPDDKISSFSSRGPTQRNIFRIKPEVAAPGRDILSASFDDNNGYKKLSGTSMACPHVAGAIALMKSQNRSLTFDQANERLQNTAYKPRLGLFEKLCTPRSIFTPYPNNVYGNGRIDVAKAMGITTK